MSEVLARLCGGSRLRCERCSPHEHRGWYAAAREKLVNGKPSSFSGIHIRPGFSKFTETEVLKKIKEQKSEAQLRTTVD